MYRYLSLISALFALWLLCTCAYAEGNLTEHKTILGEDVYEEDVLIEEDTYYSFFTIISGERVEEFIQYDIYGEPQIYYKTESTPLPEYDVYGSNGSLYDLQWLGFGSSGETITVPDCELEPGDYIASGFDCDEYEFYCWVDDAELHEYFPGDTMLIPDRNVFLYAVFVKPSVETIRYLNFMSSIPSDDTPTQFKGWAGDEFELPECWYVYPGFTFSYWTDGESVYNSGDTFTMPDHDVTFSAVWTSAHPVTPGDVDANGTVDATDRMILARYLADWDGYAEKVLSMDNADVDGNNQVDTADLVILARSLSGWDGYRRYIDSMPSNMIN